MYIHVRVLAGQKAESVTRISDSKYRVSVRAKALRNQANARVLELMREQLGVRSVKIVSGHHGPSKLLAVDYPIP